MCSNPVRLLVSSIINNSEIINITEMVSKERQYLRLPLLDEYSKAYPTMSILDEIFQLVTLVGLGVV